MKRMSIAGAAGAALILAVAGLLAHGSGPGTAAAAAAACTSPPPVYTGAVTPGLTGTGKTVLQGTAPTSFGAEVLGVLNDGVAPGIDMIVVKLSGPVVTQAGGAFQGISGSPVYVNGKLLGAVSYVLSYDRTVAGLTPAAPMMKLFGYPRGPGSAAAHQPHMATDVPLTRALRRSLGTAPGANAGASMRLLRMPIAVSGLTDTGLQRLQKVFDRYGLAYTAVRGGAGAVPAGVSGQPIVAGGNFAVTQSFGDVTYYGLGTATAVCNGDVVAFGHPFFLQGPTALGMNNADAITVLKDPFDPYKLANITGFRGMVDQDRLAGVRGITGEMPALTDLTTHLRNADLGTSRDGHTAIADQSQMGPIAQQAAYVENIVTFDREGSGSEAMSWKITGSFQGDPFTLTRTGMAYSNYDIPYDSTYELAGELGALTSSKFGAARITGIDFGGTLTQRELTTHITRVESRSAVQPNWKVRRTLRVRPGGTVGLRVTLTDADGTTRVSRLAVELGPKFRGATMTIRGGNAPEGCPYCAYGERFRTSAKSFQQLLAQFRNGEHSNDLIAAVGKVKGSVLEPRIVGGSARLALVRPRHGAIHAPAGSGQGTGPRTGIH